MQATQMPMLKPRAKQNTVIHVNRVWWNTAVVLLFLFIVVAVHCLCRLSGSALSRPYIHLCSTPPHWYMYVHIAKCIMNKGETIKQREEDNYKFRNFQNLIYY